MNTQVFEPEKEHMVLKGRDGWLFLTNDTNKVIDQITGNLPLSSDEVARWVATQQFREQWLASIGSQYLFAVAPNKEVVFANNLPEGISVSEHRPVTQLLSAGVPLLYQLSELSKPDTYSKTDTHWSDLGGKIQATEIINAVRAKGVRAGSIDAMVCDFTLNTHTGDLGRKVSPPAFSVVHLKRVYSRVSRVTHNSAHQTTGQVLIFEEYEKSDLPNAVMFTDSFGGIGSVVDFIAQCFSRLVVVWRPTIDFELVEKERPAVVIAQMAERFLIRVPDDAVANGYAAQILDAETVPRQRLLRAL